MGRPEDLFKRLCELGEQAIDQLIADRQSEELFLDFKRSADGGEGSRLHEDDRKNLAKAISGFGNSEGGVVVWGVDCRSDVKLGDVAQCKTSIFDPVRFKSWLEGAVSGCTVPPHPMVRHHAIGGNSGRGFVVTFIGKSYYAPHQCLKPALQYYIRAGSDFVPTPHAVLAGLFGRRPQPFIFHMWDISPPTIVSIPPGKKGIEINFGIQIGSHGPGLARDLYISLDFLRPKGGSQAWITPDKLNWTGTFNFGRITQLVSNGAFKLAPQSFATPIIIKLVLARPFESDLSCKLVFGHEGSPTRKVEKSVNRELIDKAFDEYLGMAADQLEGNTSRAMETFLGIGESSEDAGPEYYGFPD